VLRWGGYVQSVPNRMRARGCWTPEGCAGDFWSGRGGASTPPTTSYVTDWLGSGTHEALENGLRMEFPKFTYEDQVRAQ